MSPPLIVFNPASGGAGRLEEMREALRTRGLDARWVETTPEDSGTAAARRAVAEGSELVVAAGGDGTVRACAAALIDSDVALGVLPLGTGNLLARNLGIPLDPASAVDALVDGRLRVIDVGVANDEPFVVMAGLGLDARMIEASVPEAKARFGPVAYLANGLRHVRRRPFPVALEVDGERRLSRATMVLVGNTGELPGGLVVFPDADPTDGLLEVLVVQAWGWWGWLRAVAGLLLRRERTLIRYHRVRRLTVEPHIPEPWEVDGEERPAATRLEVGTSPGALRVRVPRESEGD